MVEPAIFKAVQGVEQGHVQQADHLSDGVDGEEANDHTLEDVGRHNIYQNTFLFTFSCLPQA